MKQQVFPQAIAFGLIMTICSSIVLLETNAIAQMQATWYNCRTREVFTPEKQVWCDRWKTLQNATYIVPASLTPDAKYIKVTLNNGRYQREDQKFIVELVNEKGWMTFGDLNNDGKTDAAVIFGVALDPQGKSIATYLTAVLDVDDKAQVLTPIKLGERIMLNEPISIKNNGITIPFLTQTEVINRIYLLDLTLRESL
jgi:hypothetical protein